MTGQLLPGASGRQRAWYRAWLLPRAAGLLLVCAAAGIGAQERPSHEAAELVNALLGGLLGLEPISEQELQRQVAEAGGIPFKQEVAVDFLSSEQMARYFEQVFDDEYPQERAAADQRMLVALDLLPAGADLRSIRAQLMRDNVVGFYDERPGKKRLFAVSADRSLTPSNQLVLAHELRHALQDQYMPIHDLLPNAVTDFDDRRLALLSLLEGDATLVMQRFLLSRLGGGGPEQGDAAGMTLPAPEMPGTPRVLNDQLVLPYTAGLDFARAVFERSGWSGIQEAFRNPPESTEQVLHPPKYFERERPRLVWLPEPPPGSRLLAEGVLGEMLLGSLLGDGSQQAVAGWGGDAYRTYDLSGKTLVVARSVWDTPPDQREFHGALAARYNRSHGAPRAERGFSIFERSGSCVAVGAKDSGVALLAGEDCAVLARGLALEREK